MTIAVLFVSMYGVRGAIAPIIDKANDPVMFNIFGINYYAKGLLMHLAFFLRLCPLMCALFLLFMSIDTTDLGVKI